jgi:nucleoside 2-deoxyribosyltransferase
MIVYFAAPLFTAAERAWNAEVVADLRRALAPVTLSVPQEFCAGFDAGGGPDRFAGIYRACVDHLERADAVVAVLDGPDVDSGTAWEVGFAVARGKPVIGLRTDWRPAEDGAANCMLTRGCVAIVADAAAAADRLRTLLP